MRSLNIVSFDIPYPPDYGGIIDVYYRIAALADQGVKIILHCYYKDRLIPDELNEICEEVYYYKRNMKPGNVISILPFIVNSRNNPELLQNLCKNDYPIIFEGLHTTAFLNHERLKDRIRLVRTHNIEHIYYRYLAKYETNLNRKLYYSQEAQKLKKYEKILRHASFIMAIKPSDTEYFLQYGAAATLFPFHEPSLNNTDSTKGNYILYHGNLSVNDNDRSAAYLVDTVFSKIDLPVIIAGKSPGQNLALKCARHDNIRLVPDPEQEDLNRMISGARINILYNFSPAGLKIKLLNALAMGSTCICNSMVAEGTGLESLCERSDDPVEIIALIKKHYHGNQTDTTKSESRRDLLDRYYSNKRNARLILDIIKNL